MTHDEAIKKLDAMSERVDQESSHVEADEILLRYLKHNGAPEIAEAYARARERVGFWYA